MPTTTALRVACPSCDAPLKLAPTLPPGKKLKCPKCASPFRVPDPDEEVLDAEVADSDPEPRAGKRGPAADRRDWDDDDDRPRRKPAVPVSRVRMYTGAGLLVALVAVAGVVWFNRYKVPDAVDNTSAVQTGSPAATADRAKTGELTVVLPRTHFKPDFALKEKPSFYVPTEVHLTPAGNRVSVVSPQYKDRTSQVWAVDGEPRKVTAFAGATLLIHPDGKTLTRKVKDGTEQADLETGRTTNPMGLDGYPGTFVRGGSLFAPGLSLSWDRQEPLNLFEYDLKTAGLTATHRIGPDDRARVAPAVKDGREVMYVLPRQNVLRVWDLVDRKLVREVKLARGESYGTHLNHTAWPGFQVSQPDGKWAAVNREAAVGTEVFDTLTGACVDLPPRGHQHIVEFVPGRDICLFVTAKNYRGHTGPLDVLAYDLRKQRNVAVFRGYTSPVGKLVVSADGKVMVTGHEDGTYTVWDLDKID